MSANTAIEWTDRTWRTAAKRAGVTLEEYRGNVEAGLKYCWRCRSWKARTAFGSDRSRGDGLAAQCTACRKPPRQLRLLKPTPAESARLHYATDPDYRFRRQQHAHSRKRNVAPLPIEGRDALIEKFNGCCAYCGADVETWDHIVPISKGGRTIPGNILPACRTCNSRKKDRDVYDFIDAAGIVVSPALDAELALALEWGQLSI